jgi:hypothetical protein
MSDDANDLDALAPYWTHWRLNQATDCGGRRQYIVNGRISGGGGKPVCFTQAMIRRVVDALRVDERDLFKKANAVLVAAFPNWDEVLALREDAPPRVKALLSTNGPVLVPAYSTRSRSGAPAAGRNGKAEES